MTLAIRKEILPNGLTLVTEEMPHVRSVCLGVWLRKGSRDESAAENGISHFIEHLVFKGTENRTAREIAQTIDRFGGNSDAFTGKEHTCFYAKVLDAHLGEAVDLLADIVLRPRFDAEEIEKERKVICEEIRMVEDSPDELLYDLFTETLWGGHPLGRPVQGTLASIAALDRDGILDYFRRCYRSENLVLAVAGNLSHDALAAKVSEAFASLPSGNGSPAVEPPASRSRVLLREKKDLEQLHLCVGFPAFPQADARRWGGLLMNTVLGGSMSSRLFQAVREDRGLAYSVYSALHGFADTGCQILSLATAPGQAREALAVTLAEVAKIRREPVSAEELADAKEHLKGNLLLGLESTSSRMSNLARQEITFGRQSTLDEVAADIDRVTVSEVQTLAETLFADGGATLTALGRVEEARLPTVPPEIG